jgi:MFS family permease
LKSLENYTTNGQLKLFNKYFILTFIVAFAANMGQNLINNAYSLYVVSLGYTTSFAGYVNLLYAVLAITARFWSGYLADKKSRRLTMALGCFIFALSSLFFGIIPAFWSIIIFRSLHGAGFASSYTAASAANVDVIPASRRDEGIGYFWIALAITFAFAGNIVDWLSNGDDYTNVFILSTVLLGIGIIASLLCDYEKKPDFMAMVKRETSDDVYDSQDSRGIRKFIEPKAIPASMVYFLNAIGLSSVGIFILLYAAEQNYPNAGMFFLASAVTMAFSNIYCSRVTARFGALAALIPSFLVYAAGLFCLGLSNSLLLFFVAGGTYGIFHGVSNPVLYSITMEGLPVKRRGAASCTFYVMLDIGVGIGSMLWGIVIDAWGYGAMFILSGLVQVAAAILAVLLFGKKRKKAFQG